MEMAKKALNAKRLNAFAKDPNELVVIGVDTDDGPEHPLWDERIRMPLEEAFVRNIQRLGVLEPVLVRKNGDVPEVVAGRRRVLHAREAKRRQIEAGEVPLMVPVMVKRGSDGHVAGIGESENALRVDNSVLAKARKAQRLIDFGHAVEDVAMFFGCSTVAVRNWLALLDAHPDLISAVERGVMSASAALNLAGLDRDDQRQQLETLLAEGKPTVKKTKAAAQKANGKSARMKPGKRDLKKVIAFRDELRLTNDFVLGVRFAIGDWDQTQTLLEELKEVAE